MERAVRNRESSRDLINDPPLLARNSSVNPNEISVSQSGSNTIIHIHHHHYYPNANSADRRPVDSPPPYEAVVSANESDDIAHLPRPADHRRISATNVLSGGSADPLPRQPNDRRRQSSPPVHDNPVVEERENNHQHELVGAVGGQADGIVPTTRSFISTALADTRSETRKLFLFAILKIKLAHPNYTPETAWTALVNWLIRDLVFEYPSEVATAYHFAFSTHSHHGHFRQLFGRSPFELHNAWNSGVVDF